MNIQHLSMLLSRGSKQYILIADQEPRHDWRFTHLHVQKDLPVKLHSVMRQHISTTSCVMAFLSFVTKQSDTVSLLAFWEFTWGGSGPLRVTSWSSCALRIGVSAPFKDLGGQDARGCQLLLQSRKATPQMRPPGQSPFFCKTWLICKACKVLLNSCTADQGFTWPDLVIFCYWLPKRCDVAVDRDETFNKCQNKNKLIWNK